MLFFSSSMSKSKKELPKTAATSVLGKKTSVMSAIVCIERLSSCVTLLNAWEGLLEARFEVRAEKYTYQAGDICDPLSQACKSKMRCLEHPSTMQELPLNRLGPRWRDTLAAGSVRLDHVFGYELCCFGCLG